MEHIQIFVLSNYPMWSGKNEYWAPIVMNVNRHESIIYNKDYKKNPNVNEFKAVCAIK